MAEQEIQSPREDALLSSLRALRPRIINPTKKISRFPDHIWEKKECDIRPRVVSIGPYFHGDGLLQSMERQKSDFMWYLLDKCTTFALPDLLMMIRECETIARECYSETSNLSSDEFVRMLLLDSCFIIGFLVSISNEMKASLFSLDWSIHETHSDLLLMENQIPLFVVTKVHDVIKRTWHEENFPDINLLLEPLVFMDIPWRFHEKMPLEKADHLLHLYWMCFLPDKMQETSQSNSSSWAEITGRAFDAPKNIPNATELHEVAGMKFKKRNKEGFDLRFRKGVMKMPSLKISTSKKIILTNLIGYEKSMHPNMRKVSSYMLLMDSLINTEKDVEFLQQRGIIVNTLSNNSSAATFFNEIGDMCSVDYQRHLFAELFKDVNNYYTSKWHRAFTSLRHNYFNNHWAFLAVLAAASLLILAGLQTLYTVYPYYHHHD